MERSSPMVGGGDVELVEKAKHRGRAYQCLPCYHKEGRVVINEKGRLEDHILKNHVKLDEVPYYCSLCLFRCHSLQQLNKHVTAYARHREMAKKRDIQDHQPFLMKSSNPYKIGALDYMQLSPEESIRHFTQQARQAKERDGHHPVTLAVQQMFPAELPMDISALLNLVETSPMAKADNRTAGPPPDPLPTSIGAPAYVGLCQTTDLQAGLDTPVIGQQAPHQAAAPKIVKATMAEHQDTVNQTPVVGTILHTPVLPNQTPDLFRSSVPQTASATSRIPQHQQSLSQMSAVPEGQTTATASLQPLDLSLKATPQQQIYQKSTTQLLSVPQTMPICLNRRDPDQQFVVPGSSRSFYGSTTRQQQEMAAQTLPSMPTESADLEDEAEGEILALNTPVPAVTPLGTPSAERQTPSKAQGRHPQEAEDKVDSEEDLMDQLLPQEDMELPITTKRAPSESEEPLPKRKRRSDEPTFDISLVAVNGLVAALQGLREDVTRNTKTMDRMEKTLVETNVLMSKAIDSMTRLKNVLDGNEREEKRREERRQEADRRREEERRREREEDRRREERRREAEHRDREERRRTETGSGNGQKEERRNEDRRDDTDKRRKQDKENEPRVKSVLGRSYTENAINDYGRKH